MDYFIGRIKKMNIIVTLIIILAVFCEMYDLFRLKYEVFGIIIDQEKGATSVGLKKFRTYKKALNCYNKYQKKYFTAHINEI